MERQHPIRGIRFIHKALRRHTDLIEELAEEELDLEEEIHDLMDRVDALARQLRLHTRSEEIGLFPALEARVPNVSATYLFDHAEEERLLERLANALAELLQAGAEPAGPLARARRTSVALAEHVHLHIRKEHKHVLPLVEQHFSDAEQREMIARMLATIPVDQQMAMIAWVFDTLDDGERREFGTVMKQALPEHDWRALADRIGL
jgi:hemerythrin-like domain-containing protein